MQLQGKRRVLGNAFAACIHERKSAAPPGMATLASALEHVGGPSGVLLYPLSPRHPNRGIVAAIKNSSVVGFHEELLRVERSCPFAFAISQQEAQTIAGLTYRGIAGTFE